MREWDPDEWIIEYEKERKKKIRTRMPPKAIRRIMEERPMPGRGGLLPKEKEGELWQ